MQRVILIVEDEVDAAEVLEIILGLWGYQTIVGHNGEEGYQLAAKFLPDAIVSDFMMPTLDGIQMAAKLAENTATSDIPIALMTAIRDEPHISGRIVSILRKPLQLDKLQALLDSITHKLPVRDRKPFAMERLKS